MVNDAVKLTTLEDNPQIAVVTINRPDNINSITIEVLEGLKSAADKISCDSEIRAVILTGEGSFFSSGADFSLFALAMGEKDTTKARMIGRKGADACNAWEALPQPTIVAIEGGVVGGAVALVLACDWRVMAEDAYVYVAEVKVGLNFGWGALPRLTALVGPAKAKLMSIICGNHGADECLAWGFSDFTVNKGKAFSKAVELAQKIAGFPRLPVQIIKRGINTQATALASAAASSDTEELLLCMKDEEATKYRMQTIEKIQSKGKK